MGDLIEEMFRHEFADLLERHEGIVLELSEAGGWFLLATLQLALRHPQFPATLSGVVRGIAEELQRGVATTPALAEVARRGWLAEYDEPSDAG